MKTRFFLIFCILASTTTLFAQSGRIIPTPEITSENSEAIDAKKQISPCGEFKQEFEYIQPKKIDEFVSELNELGKCGYRVEKISRLTLGTEDTVRELLVFGVVKLDAVNKYEYNWFAARRPGEIVTLANKQAESGFYFRHKMMFTSGRCSNSAEKQRKENEGSGALGDLANLGLGTSGSVFIFERKNGITKKNEYRVIDGATERGKESLEKNQKIMDDLVAKGFRPVEVFYLGMFDLFDVLMEKDIDVKPQGDYLLLREAYGINKKFAEFSNEGYLPILIGFTFAILHRNSSQPLNLSFESTEYYNEIVKKLPKLNQQGAKYQAIGVSNYQVGCDPWEGKLFFSVPKKDKLATVEKSDYKILEMSNFNERYFRKKETGALRTDPPTNEMLQEFQNLLTQGYKIKDLFWQYEIMVLFERSKQ